MIDFNHLQTDWGKCLEVGCTVFLYTFWYCLKKLNQNYNKKLLMSRRVDEMKYAGNQKLIILVYFSFLLIHYITIDKELGRVQTTPYFYILSA